MTKLEHSLADKARQIDELQQRADKFQQFAKTANREMLAQGQQMMQFFQQFNQIQNGPGPQGLQTAAGRQFSVLAQAKYGNVTPISAGVDMERAQKILRDEAVRLRNAKAAGLHDPGAGTSMYSEQEVAKARLLTMVGTNPTTQARYGHAVLASKQRHHTTETVSDNEEEFGPFLSKRELERLRTTNELSGKLFQTSADRKKAASLVATGGPEYLKYDIADVGSSQKIAARFQAQEGEIAKRSEMLKNAAGPNQEINRTLAIALDKMTQEMKNASNQYLQAMREFQQVQATPGVKEDSREFKTAFEKLQMSMERLATTNDDLTRINKSAKEAGGGGGGGTGRNEFMEKARPWAQAAAGVMGAGIAAYGLYQKTGLAMDEAALGAERAAQVSRGQIGSTLSAMGLASQDMTNPENVLKYRSDLVFGRKYDFIGTGPSRLIDMARTESIDAMDIARRQKNLNFVGAAGSVITGAGTMIGGAILAGGGAATGAGAVLAAPTGIGMMAAGANQIAGGMSGAIDNAASNRYLQAQGRTIENSFIGRWFHGTERSAANTRFMQAAVAAEEYKKYLERIDEARDAEMREKHSNDLIAFQERERMADVQQQGAILVGGYGATRGQVLGDIYGPAVPGYDRRADLRFGNRSLALADPKEALSSAAVRNIEDSRAKAASAKHKITKAQEILAMVEGGIGLTPTQAKLREEWLSSGFYDSAKNESVDTQAARLANRETARARFEASVPQIATARRVIEREQAHLTSKEYIPLVYSRAELEKRAEARGAPAQTETGYNPATAMETRTSRLQMSPSEFLGNMNMLTNVLGTSTAGGLMATGDQTERMIRLSRSGIGSFQNLLGNVAALNQTQGGSNNLQTLERVMTAAVQAGFDKSRTAQMFFQTTNELARSVNSANVGVISNSLGLTAAAMSTSGVADEKSLALAASGMKSYADYTGQRSGLVGALKMQGIFGSGGRIGSGAGIASSLNALESIGMLKELEEFEGGNRNALKSIRLRDMLALQGGDVKKTRNIISSAGAAGGRVIEAMVQGFGGFDVQASLRQAADFRRRGQTGEADKLIQQFMAKAADVGATGEIGEEGARAWAVQQAISTGALTAKAGAGLLDKRIQAGANVFNDPAKMAMRKYLDDLMVKARNNSTGMTPQEAVEYSRKTGQSIQTNAGEVINEQLLKKAESDPALRGRIESATKNIDRYELARGAEMSAANADGAVQKVQIVNIRDLALTFLQENLKVVDGGKRDLNKSTP